MLTTNLQTIVQRASGLHLDEATVSRAALRRMEMLALTSVVPYIARIQADAAEMAELIELLVVPETWLFRDPEAFAAAAQFALRRQAALGRPLRVLSLPCATGEEPYSLAMALLDAGMTPPQFTIQALDISAAALQKAEAAVYRQNAFRTEDRRFQLRYFTTTPDGEVLDASVRALVRFSQGNLLEMPASLRAQSFDIIFCRNLLIYFDETTQRRAVALLEALLDDAGLLFTGYAEMPVFTSQRFDTAQLPRAFALRKKLTVAPPAARVPMPAKREMPSPAQAPRKRVKPADAAIQPPEPPAGTQPSSATALLASARTLSDQGQFPAATAALEQYLSQVPDSAEAYALLGTIHASLGAEGDADRCLRKALYLEPNRYEVLCQLAILSEQRGDVAGAKTLRTRAARVVARERGEATQSGVTTARNAR
jgi:chemotaxis protein methyltransferase WspC